MSQRRYVHPAGWSATPGYSHAVITSGGPVIALSGQVSQDAAGKVVGAGDFAAQVRQVFENLGAVLAASGASFQDVVKFNYYVVGLTPERLAVVREVRNRYLPESPRPASTLVGVTALASPDYLIEVEALVELPHF